MSDPLRPLKAIPGVPRRFGMAKTDPPAPDSLPPKTDAPLVVHGHGMRVTVPTAIATAALGFAGSLLARPHVDVSRLESKIEALDAKVAQLNEQISRDVAAIRQRQTEDSNAFSNGINRLDGRDERLSDRVTGIDRRLELVEQRR